MLSVALSFTGSWKSVTVEKPYVCLPVLQVSTRKKERIGDSKTAAIIPAKTSLQQYWVYILHALLIANSYIIIIQTNHSSDSALIVLNQSLYNVRVEGVLLVQIVILSSENQARFSKVPRSFRTRKAIAKSAMIADILKMKRSFLYTRSFRRIRYSIFRYRLTKHVFMDPKNGKRAPGMPLLGLQ